jgi:16S rRNA (guanine966-N2)-methyltransferase
VTGRGRNRVRIIGGEWRGRQLSFPDLPDLRPSPDRVRETLFNWLHDVLPGARCLDLFAGSGALAFEAVSRGAKEALMVERHPAVVAHLKEHILHLNAQGAMVVVQAEALAFLRTTSPPFDVVFLDPPFNSDLLGPCMELLAAGAWLKPLAWIYIEAERRTALPPLPADWAVQRQKVAGQVGYYLLNRT